MESNESQFVTTKELSETVGELKMNFTKSLNSWREENKKIEALAQANTGTLMAFAKVVFKKDPEFCRDFFSGATEVSFGNMKDGLGTNSMDPQMILSQFLRDLEALL